MDGSERFSICIRDLLSDEVLKDVITGAIGEPHDLIFDRGAIAGSNAINDACIERGSIQ